MSEDFDKLKQLGVQKIHEDTHISREHIIEVIESDFKVLNKVQFLGFISILEREYSLDLSDLKAKGVEYFREAQSHSKSEPGVFIVSKAPKKSLIPYIAIVLLVVLGLFYYLSGLNSQNDIIEVQNVENKIILDVKKNIEELNTTLEDETVNIEENTSLTDLKPQDIIDQKEEIEEKSLELKEFTIIPKSKVWIGYIDVESDKKFQKTTRDIISLDRTKEWLVVLGHSHVSINATEKISSFNTKGSLYLHYKDGAVEKISSKQFKRLNKGRKW